MNPSERPVDVLITGSSGFIGYHVAARLLAAGMSVAGFDNMNAYYDVGLKEARLAVLSEFPRFTFSLGDLADGDALEREFIQKRPKVVINLAAQAGVRYSLQNPSAYIQSNVVGFANILEACRRHKVSHLLYASSSSVYGGNTKVPFSETDPVNHPVSLYAATKRSNELMADTYAHLYRIPSTGLRFFTVYGPFGRPDMAYYSFTQRYFSGETIQLFNAGNTNNDLTRDFTYVDDVVDSVVKLTTLPPGGSLPHRVLNIGGSKPVALTDFVAMLENSLSKAVGTKVEFIKTFESIKPGDVHSTFADARQLRALIGSIPETSLATGLARFADWYVSYHGIARTSTI